MKPPPADVIREAISRAMIDYPDKGNGTTWPQQYMDPAEADLYTRSVLRRLREAGYCVVPEEHVVEALKKTL